MISMSSGVALYTAATPIGYQSSINLDCILRNGYYPPLYVVPKSTPTMSRSRVVMACVVPLVADVKLAFEAGLKV